CGDNKPPGPDGYTFEIFKKYWGFIGSDFCEAVEHFFNNGAFAKGCNSSFIALIPKKMDAKLVTNFRPISLIGCVYKVVTKILANRLAMVISNIVSNTQSAFVSERHILDGRFIINEVLHWCKRKNKKAMFLKVDFAKAYDSVRWDYLIDVLEAFGFGMTWCQWIRGLCCFAKASVLVNGSPSREFQFQCGLKQGGNTSRHKFWEDVVSKLRPRLSKWKTKTLSIGGRLTLLKSVLGASPLYCMSIFKAPKGVLKEMESIRNNFFIGADTANKKITWVAWDKVLASKKNGGLGVSSYFALNRALLLKWIWRFVSQDDS
nr:RNA-directed DNA polymerase, eukaryota, reverse transcriptase zinc-binding domain protein [Tanacetum cinerariifolium]